MVSLVVLWFYHYLPITAISSRPARSSSLIIFPRPSLTTTRHVSNVEVAPSLYAAPTCNGSLESLVCLLRDFCLSLSPPENPAILFGLSPPGISRPPPVPTLNPKNCDRHAAYRFSLAFRCVVNISVRGSEMIRAHVVQAGTLDVAGCILEAFLALKGFAVGPSASATGAPRETREQRHARHQVHHEQRQREHAHELAHLLACRERRRAR